jgi:methoxymalonate biosynthesis acyl carrier protein
VTIEGDAMSIAAEVEGFIVREIAGGRGIDSLAHDRDLLEAEVIDSLGIVELIAFLEGRYAIKVDDDDLAPENFRSVDSIVAFVQSKGG